MKKTIRAAAGLLLVLSLLLPTPLAPLQPIPKASAAGEEIPFDDVTLPGGTLQASRPASYAGDPNWYPSRMEVDVPDIQLNGLKYNQVTGILEGNLSDYRVKRWELWREGLGERPKDAGWNRWFHGYTTSYYYGLVVNYKDGSSKQLSYTGGGGGKLVLENGNLAGYKNGMFDDIYPDFPNFDRFMVYYQTTCWDPDNPNSCFVDYNSPHNVVPSFRFELEAGKVPKSITFSEGYWEEYWTADQSFNTGSIPTYHKYGVERAREIPLVNNKPPTLTLTSPNGENLMNDEGFSGYNLTGYVQDPDNDALDVEVEIPNVFYKKIRLENTGSPKSFSVPIDALQDGMPPGNYTVYVKAVDPYSRKAEASLSLSVTNRVRNKAFLLINTQVDIGTKYSDPENDPQHQERYKYEHDPYFFDNPMGIIGDSGLWRSSKYTSFPYSGVYVASFQARDNPKGDDRFDEFRMWSRNNLSSMTFHVHRKPIALFTAKRVGGTIQLTDSSYDLDHVSAVNKGLIDWQWQYRAAGQEVWTDGQPGNQPNGPYEIRLRVRDVDGLSGVGVWSDWCVRTVGTPGNTPPVAMFTVTPNEVSHRKSTSTTDQSFDPDNDPLDTYQWKITKNGLQEVWSHYGSPNVPPSITQFGTGSYNVTLAVRDNRGAWSQPYSQLVTVKNHPPAAAFNMPVEVYRDTVIQPENLTPDPDADGEGLTYQWNARLNSSPYYWTSNDRSPTFTIRDLINRNGISHPKAISDGWEMRLTASDGALSSNATRTFSVKNHIPSAVINGPTNAYQYDTKTFYSADEDLDTSDQPSLRYYWKLVDADGGIRMLNTQNVTMTFNEPGIYSLEHWAVDQIGDKSNIAALKITVAKNEAPSMTLTSPPGTSGAPTILDAELQGDPLIQWTYSDPENDPQEKYRLEFFTKDSLLARTVENTDGSGGIRQYQVPNPTFERFELFKVLGRAYSKGSWSEISNEKAFIIDTPPAAGFTLMTDTGKNAATTPIYRTDTLLIKSTASDADIPKGDTISHLYYLKPAGGTEALASKQADFTKKFTTNGTFTYRQRVTDSLGLYREILHSFKVVNRLPKVKITYPSSTNPAKPTVIPTLTPTIKWAYEDEDGDLQQRYRVRILDAASGAVVTQSGEQTSGATQWQIGAGTLTENKTYIAEMEVYDGFDWSATSERKFFLVNLLSVKGGVKHTEEWNQNRQAYNLKKSGDPESPRAYNVYWAGERFVLEGKTTGLPDTVSVTMSGGYKTELTVTDPEERTRWVGELYDASFDRLPDGPVTFTFTAINAYQTKNDQVTVIIDGDWADYYRYHRIQ